MKRLTVAAAAFAAGLLAFVANAEAEPDPLLAALGFAPSKPHLDKRQATSKAEGKKPSKTTAAGKKRGRSGSGIEKPGVDKLKTASVPTRPKLKATARKSVFGLRDKAGQSDAGATKPKVAKTGRAAGYQTLVSRYAAAYGVPTSLAHAVIKVESNYRANARGSAGEIGLMQIKPSTARAMGYSGGSKGLFNPETNIKYGMKYLGMAHRLSGGKTCGTILRYNAGHGAKRMNPVSAAYCSKVKRLL